jgi:hypothetical protein
MNGIMKQTIHGTRIAVAASVRIPRGQWEIVGPASHKRKVSEG